MEPADRAAPPADAALETGQGAVVHCRGRWNVAGLADLERRLADFPWPPGDELTLDAADVAVLDTAGAWVLHRTRHALEAAGRRVAVHGLTAPRQALLEMVAASAPERLPPHPEPPGILEYVGRWAASDAGALGTFLSFVGEVTLRLWAGVARPWRLRWNALFADLQTAGFNALPIVGLLSFLLGVVIAYQGAVQLRLFGANIYVADLVGLSMVRELAPLITAIIVAGRTGSAYAAQIGTMQVTEEVAALRTIGIPPIDLLVLPKLLALMLALPLLAVFADVMGILGGMVMAKLQLGFGAVPFTDRLQSAVTPRAFLIGIGKAPVFAAIIAVVGCYQGFRVHGDAESVGRHTTAAVVQSIFLVIVTDAMFSILFSWLGI